MESRFVNALAAAAASAVLLVGFSGLIGTANAADPAEAVKQREQTMKTMGRSMGAIVKYLKNEGVTEADAKAAATAIVKESGKSATDVFPKGTEIGVGDSNAKPELWQNWSKAEGDWKAVQPAAMKLEAALNSGDRAQVAQAVKGVGGACGECHESFRRKKE